MPNIYKVSGAGRALGAKSVVLAENRDRAIRLHIRAVTAQAAEDCEGIVLERAEARFKNVDSAKIQQKDVTLRVHGKLVTEFVFFVWDGDY